MTSDPPLSPGQRRCPRCGTPVLPENKFCESCGAKLAQPPVCGTCGAVLDTDAKFCGVCGATAAGGALAPSSPISPAARAATTETVPEPRVAAPARVSPAPAPAGMRSPPSKNTLLISGAVGMIIVVAALVFVVLPMFSGHGGTTSGSVTPPVPAMTSSASVIEQTVTAVTVTHTAAVSGSTMPTPGPTQTLPSIYTLFFQADKDTITGDVTVTVTGPSTNLVKDITMKLTRADGQEVIKHMIPNEKVNEVVLSGTRNSERVEVTVLFYSGEQYKVIDKIATFSRRL